MAHQALWVLACLLVVSSTVEGQGLAPQDDNGNKCGTPTDMLFIIDKSASIKMWQFRIVKHIIESFVKTLHISDDKTHIAMMLYAGLPHKSWCFGDNTNKTELLEMVRNLDCEECEKGATSTGLALEYGREHMLTKECGVREKGVVPRTAILLTDGKSTEVDKLGKPRTWVKDQAALLRQVVDTVHVIGVGNYAMRELENIAGGQDNILTADNFYELQTQIEMINERTYKQCPPPEYVPPCKMDVVFLMDKSASMSRSDWQIEKLLVKQIIKHLSIGEDEVRVAVSLFASDVTHKFCFTDHMEKDVLIEAVENVTCKFCKPGKTVIGQALQHTHEDMLTEECGAREGVDKVVILITDGKSTEDEAYWQAQAKAVKAKAKLMTVSVGKFDQSQLDVMATDKSHAYHFETFAGLVLKLNDIVDDANCENSVDTNNDSPCEKDWMFDWTTKHCFRFFEDPVSIGDAVSMCKKLDAALPEVTTKQMHKVMRALSSGTTWLPLKDDAKNGKFIWSASGNVNNYNDMWNRGQPNGMKKNLDEQCVVMSDNYLRKWDDVSCDSLANFICDKAPE